MTSTFPNLASDASPISSDGSAAAVYYPDAVWEHRTPSEAGLNDGLLKQAIDFAIASETKAPRELVMNHYQNFGREPFD